MRTIARTAAVSFTVALAAAAIGAAPASAAEPNKNVRGADHVVFVQTDDPTGNHVVAYDRHSDGTLSFAHTYATGGVGGVLTGSVVDHLASQGSLAYDSRHALLYAVNAGSDSVSVFSVSGDRLRLRQVASSVERSRSASPSTATRSTCSTHATEVRSRACHRRRPPLPGLRVAPRARARPDRDPRVHPHAGPGGVLADGRWLVVTTKGNSSAIDVFGLDRFGRPSAAPTVNVEPDAVPFAVSFDQRRHAGRRRGRHQRGGRPSASDR